MPARRRVNLSQQLTSRHICKLFFLLAAFAGLCRLSFAADAVGQTPMNPSAASAASADSAANAESTSNNITLDFKEADINTVLRVLSIKSGINIIAGPEVQGTVTIRLENVAWDKALEV